jgi:outer membrane receptor protein involved in Fe transport
MSEDKNTDGHSLKAWQAGVAALASAALIAPIAADQAPGANDLDEIVVTARKVEERLIDVPLSIAAFTAEDIAAAGAGSIRDIAESTPGLFVSSSQGRSGDRISIRGINTVIPTRAMSVSMSMASSSAQARPRAWSSRTSSASRSSRVRRVRSLVVRP